ncbi:NaCP60E [Symbiodinium sp. CCMP2456]|nr:NaCP60E [Symbiodinium sp. CCMP2456]
MPPVNGSWDFPLSRAEKTKLLLDLYTVEVQSSHFEIAKLRQESESSQEHYVKAQGPAPKPSSPGLRQLEVSPIQQSSESAGQEAAPRRRDAQPHWSWEVAAPGSS